MVNLKNLILVFFMITGIQPIMAESPILDISTPGISLVLNAPIGGELKFVYFGKNIGDENIEKLLDTHNNINRPVYPTFGAITDGETSLRVIHSDGNPTTNLIIKDVKQENTTNGTLTTISLEDSHYPLDVNIFYQTYNKSDVIETWTKITNNEKKPVILTQYDSGTVMFYRDEAWLTHLNGSWAAECNMIEEPLPWGMKVLKNHGGNRNGHGDHPEVMISLDGKPSENTGDVIGAVLSWGGNFKMRIDTDNNSVQTLYAGINEDGGEYTLEPGKSLNTPPLILTFSDEGKGGVSRNLHRYARLDSKLHRGNDVRPLLLNSWEGIRFDITEDKMDEMMNDFAQLGGEMFVMDDGWFGVKYPRDNGSQGLGDWKVDKRKLPNGLKGLIKSAHDKGLKFGIWIEPESVNTRSELLEKHPEWALQAKYRDPHYGRGGTQLLLDLCNPDVQDMVVNMVDTLLTNNPGIDYIKWDMNVALNNYGSTYLKPDNQTQIYVDYQKGLENVLKRIREKHPEIFIQACGGGGGRVSYAMMPYFDEFWVSDNTDALQRIFMQWGMSQFYPSNAMAQHVSEVPNQCTGRTTPLKYRFDVAMSGRLGLELIPSELTQEEKEFSKKAIEEYKGIRETVQTGDLYRLISPYDNKPVASLMYVSPDKKKAVFFAYKLTHFNNEVLPHLKMKGLNPKKTYHVREINQDKNKNPLDGKDLTGDFLMNVGLNAPLYSEYSSTVLELTEITEGTNSNIIKNYGENNFNRGLNKYDFFYAGERPEHKMYKVKDGKVVWSYFDPNGRGEISDAVLMSDGHVLMAHQHGIKEIDETGKAVWSMDTPKGYEIHSIEPLGETHVVYVQCGEPMTAVVMEIPSKKIVKEFKLPYNDGGSHGQNRQIAITKDGTLLVASMQLNTVFEFDSEGNQLNAWKVPSAWGVEELPNGNILITGNNGMIRELNRKGNVVWSYDWKPSDKYPKVSTQKSYRLKNGNTIVGNWWNLWDSKAVMDPSNPPVQFIEINPKGEVVWELSSWNEPADLGPSTTIQLLDEPLDRNTRHFGPYGK